MEYKLLITRYENKIVSALYDEKRLVQLMTEPEYTAGIRLGSIYVGRIANIVKNINAAFVEIQPGVMGYLALDSVAAPVQKQRHADGKLHIGDELLVQIEREPIKTKVAALTANFCLTGKYAVLVHGKPVVGVSAKIEDLAVRNRLKELADSQLSTQHFGFILRTNAENASEAEVLGEIVQLKEKYQKICMQGIMRTAGSVVDGALPVYLTSLKENYAGYLEKIITDDREIYESAREYLAENMPEDVQKLIFYQDSLSLQKLYSLRERIGEALQKKVWLKSGATLVIEPTEALTVIDVNTGKAVKGRKNGDDFFLKINLEAAEEAARQIRLRNLSGIILVDFIDLETDTARELLLRQFREFLAKDPVKTVLVDMTALQLVEITRKKVRRPIHEEFRTQ